MSGSGCWLRGLGVGVREPSLLFRLPWLSPGTVRFIHKIQRSSYIDSFASPRELIEMKRIEVEVTE